MDGDLPKKDWFVNNRKDLLSKSDGEIHTVVPGRPFGIDPYQLASFKNQKIHLHFYGEYFHTTWREWITISKKVAEGYVHVHPHCQADQWVSELSQYDAGWLHTFNSNNHGEIMSMSWNDINYPARMSTLAAAGLPMIQKCNEGHIVATQTLSKQLDIGISFKELQTIEASFGDKERINEIRENVWKHRLLFSFDYYVKELSDFFYKVINNCNFGNKS